MSNMLHVSPIWTQNMHLIINMKMNHYNGKWKSVLQGSLQIYELHFS